MEGLRDFLKQFFVLSVKTIFTPLPLYGFYDYVWGWGEGGRGRWKVSGHTRGSGYTCIVRAGTMYCHLRGERD